MAGLVTISPRYSPKLVQERALGSPAETFKTMVRHISMNTMHLQTRFKPIRLFSCSLARCAPVQARVWEIVFKLSMFWGKLKFDDLTGQTDEPEQVKQRAAELRYHLQGHPTACALSQTW